MLRAGPAADTDGDGVTVALILPDGDRVSLCEGDAVMLAPLDGETLRLDVGECETVRDREVLLEDDGPVVVLMLYELDCVGVGLLLATNKRG